MMAPGHHLVDTESRVRHHAVWGSITQTICGDVDRRGDRFMVSFEKLHTTCVACASMTTYVVE